MYFLIMYIIITNKIIIFVVNNPRYSIIILKGIIGYLNLSNTRFSSFPKKEKCYVKIYAQSINCNVKHNIP